MASDARSTGLSRRAALQVAILAAAWPATALAGKAADIAGECHEALSRLYDANAKARALGAAARAVLIFPSILKAGAMLGGQRGEGAMLRKGAVTGFYTLSAVSYGLQLGAQRYGYALFFMTDEAIRYLETSRGWSVGMGPSVVFVDEGFAKPITSSTLSADIYAVAFGQKGLMAGGALEGAKISRSYPDP